MGCGTWGRNNFSDNMNYRHYLNITRVVAADRRAGAERARDLRRLLRRLRQRHERRRRHRPRAGRARRRRRGPTRSYAIAHRRRAARSPIGALRGVCEQRRRRASPRSACAPGDTVSLVMPNGLQTLRVLLGAMYAGVLRQSGQPAVAAGADALRARPLRLRLVVAAPDGTSACARRSRGVGARGRASSCWRPTATALTLRAALPATRRRSRHAPPPRADATALLMYTSGTTGVPKGVMLTPGQPRRQRARRSAASTGSAPTTACSPCCRSITSTPSR